jgi:hypothetical protein
LVVYPYNATSATASTVTTEVVVPTMVSSLATVTNGTFTIKIDGTQYQPTGLNFTSITSASDIVTVLQNIGLDCDFTLTSNNQIEIASRRYGTASSIEIIAPTEKSAGTAGTLTFANIDQHISQFDSVTNGGLQIYVNGVNYILTGLNFKTVAAVDTLVTTLNNAFTANDVPCLASTNTSNQLVFTSDSVGSWSSVTIGALPASYSQYTDISGSTYLDSEATTAVNGTNPTYEEPGTIYPYLFLNNTSVAGVDASGTTLQEAIAEASEKFYFGGILTTQFVDSTTFLANAQYIQTIDAVYYDVIRSLNQMATLGNEIKTSELTKTRLNCYSDADATTAKQYIAGYASYACSTNYNGTDTALTMNLKTISGISADSNLNQSWYNAASQNGVDIYGNTEGLSCVYSFSNGKYTDEATMDLWLKKALEVAGFNYLRKTNTKIPQTNKGIVGLANAYINVLQTGVRNGCIGTGLSWNDSIPFGDPEVFQENIEKFGYYVYWTPIAQQSQTEREARVAPLIQIAVKRAGAIHSSNVIVNIQA